MRPLLTMVVLLAALTPSPARADCTFDVMILSRTGVAYQDLRAGPPAANTELVGCLYGGDTRWIVPGATQVKVRFDGTAGVAHLSGLGLDVWLPLATTPEGLSDSEWVPLPDPTASGSITASVAGRSETYFTVT